MMGRLNYSHDWSCWHSTHTSQWRNPRPEYICKFNLVLVEEQFYFILIATTLIPALRTNKSFTSALFFTIASNPGLHPYRSSILWACYIEVHGRKRFQWFSHNAVVWLTPIFKSFNASGTEREKYFIRYLYPYCLQNDIQRAKLLGLPLYLSHRRSFHWHPTTIQYSRWILLYENKPYHWSFFGCM